jgi:LysR family glycine cleavage system transcriptional activator
MLWCQKNRPLATLPRSVNSRLVSNFDEGRAIPNRPTRNPPLRALVVFEVAARHMSFQLAARELNLTPSAVSHQVKSLETHLSRALFVRSNRSLALTPAGRNYYVFVRDALQKISDGSRALQESPRNEVLTVRSGGSFAERWLLPRLPLFLSENPRIDLVIDSQRTIGAVRTADIDVEIRYGRPTGSDLEVEPLREETILPLCSPMLIRGANPLRDISDLANHTLIESKFSQVTWSMWLSAQKGSIRNLRQLLFDRTNLALQAAVYGLGVALEGDFLAKEELATGRLVTPFLLRDTAMRVPLRFLVIPRSKRRIHTVRAFRDWITREMRVD